LDLGKSLSLTFKVDMMSYLELNLINELLHTNHGSTNVDLAISIKLAQRDADLWFDLFILET
jgi:hypothetical protein